MNIRRIWVPLFLVLTGGALGMELWAGLDSSSKTVPWTELISGYIPQPITMTAIAVLATWLPAHFAHHYVGEPRPDRYSKTITAAVTAGLVALGSAITDDTVTRPELIAILTAIAGGLGVYAVPNARKEPESTAVLRAAWEAEHRAPGGTGNARGDTGGGSTRPYTGKDPLVRLSEYERP